MTDRTSGRRKSGGRSDRPSRKGPNSSKPSSETGRRPAAGKGRSSEGPEDERPRRSGPSSSERPASKRAGRRPPKAERTTSWPKSGPPEEKRPSKGRPTREGASERRSPEEGKRRPTSSGSERTERPERGFRERDARTKRYVGRGPDRTSKRGKEAEEGIGDGRIRLNRFLSQSGVASRRDADDLITAGVVTVNGKVVTELGTKVGPGDKVHYGGQRLSMEKKRYVLLNKPKDFITTTDDPQNRRTVMALIDDACTERLYPVGRLDRHTTGLLLMTNDGDLAKKLTHPSNGAEKIYHVTLDKSVTKVDLERLVKGLDLDDGLATADEASYVVNGTKKEVGIKIHMGRNRIVRRMFEAMGYEVLKLDRVIFAGLTKRDLPRSKWRHLTEKEVLFLSKRK